MILVMILVTEHDKVCVYLTIMTGWDVVSVYLPCMTGRDDAGVYLTSTILVTKPDSC